MRLLEGQVEDVVRGLICPTLADMPVVTLPETRHLVSGRATTAIISDDDSAS